jgi:hypothetical protein
VTLRSDVDGLRKRGTLGGRPFKVVEEAHPLANPAVVGLSWHNGSMKRRFDDNNSEAQARQATF